MRKISKSRGDDDVVSSTNGSGSVAEADEVQPEQPPPEEDKEEENDAKEDDLEKEDNGVGEQELEEEEEEEEPSARKSKPKSKVKPKKKKSDKAKKAAKDEEYEVEKIIDSKRIKGKVYYLIRWKGYSADSDTWEPQHTVSCPDLISKYNEEKENSKNDSPKTGKKRKATSKKAVNKTPAKRTKSSWDSEKADENEEYEVERILEVQFKKNGQRQFLIHWKGWSSKFDSWEPENNLNCPDLIKKFMDKVEAARKVDSRNLRVAPGTTNRFTLQSPTSGRRLSKRRGQRQRVRYDDAE